MAIWRLHIKPEAQGVDPVSFCRKHGIIGMGWPVADRPNSKEAYLESGARTYTDGRAKGWRRAANAFLHRMKERDLVWFRDTQGVYFLAKVASDWNYEASPENVRADLVNIRKAEIYEVGTAVAGKIVNCCRAGATVQAISSDTVDAFSRQTFNRLAGRQDYSTDKPAASQSVFDLLSDVDLEDVVGLYLQLERGYAVVPSSRSTRNDTPFYEFELVSRKDASPAYVQVKSGNVVINVDHYVNFRRTIFLFSPAGYSGTGSADTVALTRAEIEGFLRRSKAWMPLSMRTWLDYIGW